MTDAEIVIIILIAVSTGYLAYLLKGIRAAVDLVASISMAKLISVAMDEEEEDGNV